MWDGGHMHRHGDDPTHRTSNSVRRPADAARLPHRQALQSWRAGTAPGERGPVQRIEQQSDHSGEYDIRAGVAAADTDSAGSLDPAQRATRFLKEVCAMRTTRHGWGHSPGLILWAIIAALGLVAVPERAAAQGASAGQVTFTKDIAPVLQRSCENCHRKGGVAPMPLTTYDEVRPWARAIKTKTAAR